MPEFLQTRFDDKVRLVFACFSLIGYIFIELASSSTPFDGD
jgi:Na+/proline symporter